MSGFVSLVISSVWVNDVWARQVFLSGDSSRISIDVILMSVGSMKVLMNSLMVVSYLGDRTMHMSSMLSKVYPDRPL